MLTKDGFFEDCGYSTLRHLRSEQISSKRETTEEIEPWYLRESKEVKRKDKPMFWERSGDNSSDLSKKKTPLREKERPKHPKSIYRLAKINPEISEPLVLFSRREKTEEAVGSNLTVSRPFKQMRQAAEGREVWGEESWPERRQTSKEPGKSVYLALFKYKQLKIRDSLLREKVGEELGANLHRYSLLSHLPDEDCLQKMPTIAKKLEIGRSNRRGKVVAVGLQKMNSHRKKTVDLLFPL